MRQSTKFFSIGIRGILTDCQQQTLLEPTEKKSNVYKACTSKAQLSSFAGVFVELVTFGLRC
jgi:hypothetical protein